MPNKRSRQPDWTAVRLDCLKRERSFAAIAAAHGISVATLRKRRKLWEAEKTDQRSDEKAAAESPIGEREPASDTGIDHLSMVRRLYHATDQQIRHLEQQLKNGSAAFDEKEARMLGTIARTLDKIMELNPQGQDDANDRKEASDDSSEDTGTLDLLRDELARRLDGLKQGTAGELSGESQPL
jgi:hypothetical protein